MRIALWLGGNKGHPYKKVAPILKAIAVSIPGAKVAVFTNKSILAGNVIKFFDCVVTYTQGGEFLPGEEDLLFDFIASGKGLVGIHGATASFKESPRYHQFIGGKFTGHGLPCKFESQVTALPHIITQGIQPFVVKDEPYEHALDRDNIHILLERQYKGKTEPVVWTKEYGRGRIVYLAYGHYDKNLKHDSVKELVRRAIIWSMKATEVAPRECSHPQL